MPTLLVQLPGLPPVSHIVRDETTTIGRMKSNSIVIDDSSVSLMHAKITRKNGDYYLKDLNSTNGTIVNGQPVGEAKLKDLDRVRFAEVSTQFLAEPSLEVLAALPTATSAQTVSSAAAAAGPAITTIAPAQSPPPPQTPAPIPAQVLGLVASLDPAKSPSATRNPAAAQSLQSSTLQEPAGTTLIRVRERPKPRFSVLVGAGIGALSMVLVLGVVGWRFANLRTSHDKVAENNTPQSHGNVAAAAEKAGAAPNRVQNLEPNAPRSSPRPLSPQSAISDNPLELAILLKSQDVALRRQAARSLHALGPEASKAASGLHEAVADPDDEVRMWAALALVNSQEYDKRAVPVLVHVLKNENSVLRQVACLSLGLVPYEDKEKDLVVPALAEIAGKDTDEDVRKAAKSALNIIAPDLYGKDKDVVH